MMCNLWKKNPSSHLQNPNQNVPEKPPLQIWDHGLEVYEFKNHFVLAQQSWGKRLGLSMAWLYKYSETVTLHLQTIIFHTHL
jgi:hypothetical protein